ncbi:DnaJ-domain-containing protein [Meredithblackwellia eburnea MCA 4105]
MAGGQYTYDSSGQSYFFLLTILLIVLVPLTITTIRGSKQDRLDKVKYPCQGWNVKVDSVKKTAKGKFGARQILLATLWCVFAVVLQRASVQESQGLLYDPYKILGISTGASEKEIKRHYKKAAVKFHPDKIKLADNQTKEEADNHFTELTKAYKSLTDADIRKNFELFGHPDGKQEFQQGIALPSWIVEGRNVGWVMGAYALVLGVMLPYFVGKWWYGTRRLTKDGILTTTATHFFRSLEEHTTFEELLDIISGADDFKIPNAKGGGDAEVERLRKELGLKEGTGRVRVLVGAYLERKEVKDRKVLVEQHSHITLLPTLLSSLLSISLSHNWLSTTILLLHTSQFVQQALSPTSSPLLQLPHIDSAMVEEAAKVKVRTVEEFGRLEVGDVEKVMKGRREWEKREAWGVAKVWPVVDVEEAKFRVVGESHITPSSIVSLSLSIRLSPPGQHRVPVVRAGIRDAGIVMGEGEEDFVSPKEGEEGKEEGADEEEEDKGEREMSVGHAPFFPGNRKPTYSIFIGDHKLNRVFVAPLKITDLDVTGKVARKVRMTFPAPPGPGLYTFQLYVMSDAIVGGDYQRDMRMKVDPPSTSSPHPSDDEDDISEPDEDTIAGQMALMKGQPVRRARDDDESGTDESGTEESESDSDSDDSSDDD